MSCLFQALGGAGTHQYGGAGGGGRIAVEWETPTWWFGQFRAYGGSGTSDQHGGPGTVYITVRARIIYISSVPGYITDLLPIMLDY